MKKSGRLFSGCPDLLYPNEKSVLTIFGLYDIMTP